MKREKTDPNEKNTFEAVHAALEAEKPLRLVGDDEISRDFLRGYALITDKPLLVVVNRREGDAGAGLPEGLEAELEKIGSAGIALSAEVESEIAQLEPEDQAAFLADMGMAAPALDRFIRATLLARSGEATA